MIPLRKDFFKPDSALRVLSLLDGLASGKSLSQFELGRRTSLSGAMVNKYLKKLSEEGYIRILPIDGKRLSYTLTPLGEAKRRTMLGTYCAEIVQVYSDLKSSIREKLTPLKEQGVKSLVLFGAWETCEVVLAAMEGTGLKVMALVDNDPAKQGQDFHGHTVFPPGVLSSLPLEAVVITSFGRQDEIHAQLEPLSREKPFHILKL